MRFFPIKTFRGAKLHSFCFLGCSTSDSELLDDDDELELDADDDVEEVPFSLAALRLVGSLTTLPEEIPVCDENRNKVRLRLALQHGLN